MQHYTQQGTIDDKLFMPLSTFFVNDNPDFKELEQLISATGLPSRNLGSIEQYKGFVLEAYVKWSLGRFAEMTGCPISPSQHSTGVLRNGRTYDTDNWGNVVFYNPRTKRTVAEVDGMYEYQEYGTIAPVILEISFVENSAMNLGRKDDSVKMLYPMPRHYLKIRPAIGDENLGVYRRIDVYKRFKRSPERRKNYREIVIPTREEFDQVDDRLMAKN